MYHDTPELVAGYHTMVGKRVVKKSRSNNAVAPKPFKSTFRVNTVKAVVFYPHTEHACFLFEEDDSYVRCYQCRLADTPQPSKEDE